MKKNLIAVLITAAVIAALFVIFPAKIAGVFVIAIIFGVLIFGSFTLGLKAWSKLAEIDPKEAEDLWRQTILDMDRVNYIM